MTEVIGVFPLAGAFYAAGAGATRIRSHSCSGSRRTGVLVVAPVCVSPKHNRIPCPLSQSESSNGHLKGAGAALWELRHGPHEAEPRSLPRLSTGPAGRRPQLAGNQLQAVEVEVAGLAEILTFGGQ
jgi:hypothetical protein